MLSSTCAAGSTKRGIVVLVVVVLSSFMLHANAEEMTGGFGRQGSFSVPFTIIKPTADQPKPYNNNNSTTGAALRSTAIPEIKKQADAQQSLTLNQAMIGNVSIGGMSFEVIFDSGSSLLWVFGKAVNKDYFTSRSNTEFEAFHHQFYDISNSPNFRRMRTVSREIAYADGTLVTYMLGYDSVKVGGDITMKDTPFGIAHHLHGPKDMFVDYDGIFGLGYTRASHGDNERFNPFTKMVKDGLLQENMYSVYMSTDGSGGEIMFGGMDAKHFKRDVPTIYAPISEDLVDILHSWIIKSEAIQLGNVVIRRRRRRQRKKKKGGDDGGTGGGDNYGSFNLEIDTGSSHIILPHDLFTQDAVAVEQSIIGLRKKGHNSRLRGRVQCAVRGSLPHLVFEVGGQKLTLTGYDYTTDATSSMHPPAFQEDSKGNKMCRLLLLSHADLPQQHRRGMKDRIIVGAPLIQKYYTSFINGGPPGNSSFVAFSEAIHPKKRRNPLLDVDMVVVDIDEEEEDESSHASYSSSSSSSARTASSGSSPSCR